MIYNSSKPLLITDSYTVTRDMQELVFSLSTKILESKYSRISGGNY